MAAGRAQLSGVPQQSCLVNEGWMSAIG